MRYRTEEFLIHGMVFFLIALVIAAVVLPIIFADRSPINGTVIGKGYSPASDDFSFIYLPDGNGGITMIPTITHNDEYWYLIVS